MIALLIPACGSTVVAQEMNVADVFSDHMVLQQNRRVPVWGTASRGARIKVTFSGQTVASMADEHGQWRVELAPLRAQAGRSPSPSVSAMPGPP